MNNLGRRDGLIRRGKNSLQPALREVFTENGTFKKKAGARWYRLVGVGGGASAGSGAASDTGTLYGGTGAQHGAWSERWISADQMPDEVDVTIGQGGPGVSGNLNTNGSDGIDGGDTIIAGLLIAKGGRKGKAGTTAIATPANDRAVSMNGIYYDGAGGGKNGDFSTPPEPGKSSLGGGGSGAGGSAGNVSNTIAGTAAGRSDDVTLTPGGGTPAGADNGVDGASYEPEDLKPGESGSGAFGRTGTGIVGYKGGNGGFPGGASGGGGAVKGLNCTGGPSGDAAHGIAVIEWGY